MKRSVFMLMIMVALLWPMAANAQESGGLFGWGKSAEKEKQSGLMRGNVFFTGQGDGFTFGTGEPEDPTPLGNGVAILLFAGAGYLALKRKEDQQ